MTRPSPSHQIMRMKWSWLYVAFVSFYLLTISSNIYLNRKIEASYEQVASINQHWNERLDRYANLAQLASEVNAAGKDVFYSQKATAEAHRMQNAWATFNQAFTQAQDELKANVPLEIASPLLDDFIQVRLAMDEMKAEATRLLDDFQNTRQKVTAEREATMARQYAQINATLADLNQRIRDIQKATLRSQQQAVASLQLLENLIVMLNIIMMFCILFYGYQLIQAMTKGRTARARNLLVVEGGEARYRNLYENNPLMYFTVAADGTILYLNNAGAKELGYTKAELIGQSVLTLFLPEEHPLVLQHTEQCLQSPEEIVSWELRKVDKHGRLVWVKETAQAVKNPAGDYELIIACENITEHKLAQEALRESEERYALALRGSNDGIWEWTIETEDIYFSPRWKESLGYEDRELPNTYDTFRSLVHPDDFKLISAAVEAHLKTGSPFHQEFRLRHKNGEYRWFLSRGQAALGKNGKLVKMGGSTTDITQRKEAEEKIRRLNEELEQRVHQRTQQLATANETLRVSEARVRALLEALPDTVFRLSGDGTYLDFSAPDGKTFIAQEKIIGSNIKTSGFPDEVRDAMVSAIDRALSTGQVETLDYALPMPGASRHYEARIVRSGADEVVAAVRDITERKQAEEALRASEQRFYTAFHASPISMSILTLKDGRYLDVNETFLRRFGSEREEVIGRTAAEISVWANPEEQKHVTRMLFKQGSVHDLEVEFLGKDGHRSNHVFSAELVELDGEPCVICASQNITEHKQAEVALRASEEKFYKAFHASPTPMAITKIEDGSYVDINQSSLAFSNLTRDDIIGKTVHELGVWIEPNARENIIRKLYEQGAVLNEEVRFGNTYGKARDGLFSAVAIEINGEQCMLSTINDITKRKRMEKALRSSEEYNRALFEHTPVGLVVMRTNGTIVKANQAYARLTGHTVEEIQGMTYRDLTPRRYDDVTQQVLRLLAETGSFAPYEKEYFHKDGHLVPVRVQGLLIEQDGEDQVLCSVEDIAEQKRAAKALGDSEHQLRQIIDLVPQFIFAKDQAGRFILANEPFAKSFGKQVEEILGKTLADFIPAEEIVRQLQGNEREVLRTGNRLFVSDMEIPDARGRIRAFQTTLIPFSFTDKIPQTVLGVSTDITQRKRTEARIRKLNVELERRVQERTAQLAAANKELEAFCYSVSHDLRAPLRSIDGFSKVLLGDYLDALDEKGRNYLQRVRTATQRMGQLIDDLLNLSRLTRSEMCYTQVDLSRLARNVAGELQKNQPERQVECLIEADLVANADPRLMRILFENLLGNAWKFTGQHPTAEIKFGAIEDNGRRVFYIQDDGAGFDMAYMDLLFGAFQRLHSAKEFDGTGIGLATVQRIVNRHGGTIWATSAVEKGATFFFTLEV